MNILPIKVYKQQSDHTCGPAALKTFLHYHKLDKSYNERLLAKVLHTCPIIGTKFEAIQTFFWSKGINIECSRDELNIPLLIDKKQILLTEWIDWGGHFVIICGYDDKHFYLADSAAEEGITKVAQDRFLSMWFTKSSSFANYLYLT